VAQQFLDSLPAQVRGPLRRLSYSWSFLRGHPAFRSDPLRVASRIALWEIYKLFRWQPVISVHARSRMRLVPGRRRGVSGLIFAFREAIEPGTREAIRRHVRSGDTVFDIGANFGLWSLLLAELVGDAGRVEAFEPAPATAHRLEENITLSRHKNVHVNTMALGSQNGEVSLYVPYDPGRAALAPESDRDEKVTVPCRRLDDVWAELGRPRVSFVKMDVEGSEPEVLRGGHEFFSVSRPVVACEVNAPKLKAMGEQDSFVYDYYRNLMYDIYEYDDGITDFESLASSKGGDGWYDILCVPQS
jgi:FkbM family methyltransferase